jgi:cytidylate kinase
MKFVITISREYGSGGRFIGKLVAEKLGISFYDSEILTKASELTGISKVYLESYDEFDEETLEENFGTIYHIYMKDDTKNRALTRDKVIVKGVYRHSAKTISDCTYELIE